MNTLLVTFDYSITSPAMVVWHNDELHRIFAFHKSKTWKDGPIHILKYPDWSSQEARAFNLADTFEKRIPDADVIHAVFEGYAFAAKGRVFHIAEAAGAMKTLLIERRPSVHFDVVAPATAKKQATGNGRASKDDMLATFETRYPDAHRILSEHIKLKKPTDDIVDACLLGDAVRTLGLRPPPHTACS